MISTMIEKKKDKKRKKKLRRPAGYQTGLGWGWFGGGGGWKEPSGTCHLHGNFFFLLGLGITYASSMKK